MEDVDKYFEKYNDIENLILENKIQDEEDILINLKDDLKTINKYKNLVNKSKAIMIKINKSKYLLQNKKKLEKSINQKIDLLNHHNVTTLSLIFDSYKTYLNINYDLLNNKIENILLNINKFQYLDFYSIVNHKKNNKKNNLEKLINSISFKNSFLFSPKIIFFDIFDVFDSYSSIINFIDKFNYTYYKKSKKLLKRGFLFEAYNKDFNKDYIIKYQPNKSFIEILMNKYLSKYNHLQDYILYPEYFFINKNNSYFYIIEKYDCDLYQFLKKRKKPIDDFQIIFIIQFLIKIIYYLHNLNIIYADLKLENLVVKIKDNNIKKMKLIDFDVSLFNDIPSEFSNFDPKILKLLNNKKPRGTKIYMSNNETMEKSNDIYSLGTFIIILFYKNIMKILYENEEKLSDNLLSKMYNRLTFYKNKLEEDEYKIKLMKYIFRIYNDRRFNKYWTHHISIKDIYINIKRCINQTVSIDELFNEFILI